MTDTVSERPVIASVNVTTACNLACSYCHAIHRREHMSEPDISASARALGALDEHVQVVPFGGEPLVAWRSVVRLVEACESHGVREFMLCTNALLADDERIGFLATHRVEVTISWDGVPAANDALRIYGNGAGTSAEIERVLDRFCELYPRRLHLRITVGPETVRHFAASIRHAFDRLGAHPGVKVCFMPVSTDAWTEQQLATFEHALCECADTYVSCRRAGRDVALAYNECLRAHELGEEILFDVRPSAHACLWGVKMLGVDTDGGIYPCHTVIELRKEQREHLRIGDLETGVPRLARRLELVPPASANPHHACFAYNLVGSGDPYTIPAVYRRVYRAFVLASVRVVEALAPAKAARARQAAERLIAEAASSERELLSQPRPACRVALSAATR